MQGEFLQTDNKMCPLQQLGHMAQIISITRKARGKCFNSITIYKYLDMSNVLVRALHSIALSVLLKKGLHGSQTW